MNTITNDNKIEEDTSNIPEWRIFYINHQLLKSIINPLKLKKNDAQKICIEYDMSIKNNKIIQSLNASNESLLLSLIEFKTEIVFELNRILVFYFENLKYYYKRHRNIINQLNYIRNQRKNYTKSMDVNKKNTITNCEIMKILNKTDSALFDMYIIKPEVVLERALKELYKEIVLMKNFLEYNIQIERGLLKKVTIYCEVLFTDNEYKSILHEIRNSSLEPLTNTNKLSFLISEIEKWYMKLFYHEYKLNAKKILTDYACVLNKLTAKQFFILGLFWGIFVVIILLLYSISNKFKIDSDVDPEFNSIFPIFRGQINICLLLWIWCGNVYFWNKYSINYRLILGFSNHFSNLVTLLKRATGFSILVTISILYYMVLRAKCSEFIEKINLIPIRIIPLISWICILIYFLWPSDGFNHKGRRFVYNELKEILMNLKIETVSFFIVSHLNSSTGIIRDGLYSICYYLNYSSDDDSKKCDPVSFPLVFLSLFPFMILNCAMILKFSFTKSNMFVQSINIIRWIFNFTTVITSMTLKHHSNYWVVWCGIASFTAVSNFFWDTKLGWGLLNCSKKENFLLRDELSLLYKYIYYLLMIIDLVLRFLWVLIISPDVVYTMIKPEFVLMVLYFGETIRRGISNYLNIENEHISICKTFRATQVIELPYMTNSQNEYLLKSSNFENKERDKIKERLNVIIEKSKFYSHSKIISTKDFISKLNEIKTDEFTNFDSLELNKNEAFLKEKGKNISSMKVMNSSKTKKETFENRNSKSFENEKWRLTINDYFNN